LRNAGRIKLKKAQVGETRRWKKLIDRALREEKDPEEKGHEGDIPLKEMAQKSGEWGI